MLLTKFPPDKAGLATVGYTLCNPDDTVYRARTTDRNILANGRYSATPIITEAWRGYVLWDTGDAAPLEAEENITVIAAPLSAADYIAPDNDGIAAIPTNPLQSNDPRLNSLDLLVDIDAEVDTIHTAIGSLGGALTAGLATETTQTAILELLTITGNDQPVAPVPVSPRAGMQTLYGEIIGPDGEPVADVTVTAELNGSNTVNNKFLIHQQLTGTSQPNGSWALILVQGARYNITIPGHQKTYQNLTITAAGTATLESYLKKVTP
jgi:hypothetical protein